MTLLDLPHGKTQINESQKFNATDRAANKWGGEPEAEQSGADQMRDTDEGSATAATPTTQNIQEIPDWAEMTRAQRKKWMKWGGRGR